MKGYTRRGTRNGVSSDNRISQVARTRALELTRTQHVAMLWGSALNDDTGEREPAWCPAAVLETPMLPALVDQPEGVISCDGQDVPLHIVRALIRGAKACTLAAKTLAPGEAREEATNAAIDALYTLGQLGVVIPELSRAPGQAGNRSGAL